MFLFVALVDTSSIITVSFATILFVCTILFYDKIVFTTLNYNDNNNKNYNRTIIIKNNKNKKRK